MLVKIAGALSIVVAGGLVGRTLATNYDQRPSQLRACQHGLQMLETEISYSATPLPEAWQHLGRVTQSPIREIFDQAHQLYCAQPGITAGEAWNRAVLDTYDANALNQEDAEILRGLGGVLGISSSYDQGKHLNLALNKLQQQEEGARIAASSNGKQLRYLGVLGGMMLALMII